MAQKKVLVSVSGYKVVEEIDPWGGRHRVIRPIEASLGEQSVKIRSDLFKKFAALPLSEDAILEFVTHYGPLGVTKYVSDPNSSGFTLGYPVHESVTEIYDEVMKMKCCLELWELVCKKRDGEFTRKRVFEKSGDSIVYSNRLLPSGNVKVIEKSFDNIPMHVDDRKSLHLYPVRVLAKLLVFEWGFQRRNITPYRYCCWNENFSKLVIQEIPYKLIDILSIQYLSHINSSAMDTVTLCQVCNLPIEGVQRKTKKQHAHCKQRAYRARKAQAAQGVSSIESDLLSPCVEPLPLECIAKLAGFQKCEPG